MGCVSFRARFSQGQPCEGESTLTEEAVGGGPAAGLRPRFVWRVCDKGLCEGLRQRQRLEGVWGVGPQAQVEVLESGEGYL